MRGRITEKVVKELEAPARGNRVTWDTELVGFGARVTAAGVTSFVLRYVVAGRERRMTIGRWPAWSVSAAREEAKEMTREVDRGRDPLQEKEDARGAVTVSELCDRYLVEYVEVHNKASTAKEFRRIVEKRIKPRLGRLKAAAVTRDDVAQLHREMRGTPRSANHVLAVLSKMFNLGEVWGVRPDGSNPCRHVKRYREAKRERFLSGEELGRLGRALADSSEVPGAVAAIRLLALTGCRAGEVVGLTWDRVDTDRGVVNLADAKAGARPVPLGAPALEVLAGIERNAEWVCEAAPAVALTYNKLNRAWRRVSKAAGLDGVRLHDLRHGFGTAAGGLGLNAFTIRDLLGHRGVAMTGQYVQKDTDPLRRAADRVSGQIAAAMKGEEAEVVPMKKGG